MKINSKPRSAAAGRRSSFWALLQSHWCKVEGDTRKDVTSGQARPHPSGRLYPRDGGANAPLFRADAAWPALPMHLRAGDQQDRRTFPRVRCRLYRPLPKLPDVDAERMQLDQKSQRIHRNRLEKKTKAKHVQTMWEPALLTPWPPDFLYVLESAIEEEFKNRYNEFDYFLSQLEYWDRMIYIP